ncbi:MAG: hypothetical protein AB1726_16170 [Planctomycetota bacterium]
MVPCSLLALLLLVAPTPAEDAAYDLRLAELELGGATLPAHGEALSWEVRPRIGPRWPYAAVDGGEAYVVHSAPAPGGAGLRLGDAHLVLRAPAGRDVHGTLFVPNADWSGMEPRPFTIPAARASAAAADELRRARAVHYASLASSSLPGAAWFRHRADETRAALPAGTSVPTHPWRAVSRETELEDTFALFSGGRAVSENLQLDRLLPAGAEDGESVALDEIEGIDVKEIDWAPLLGGTTTALDPLASLVPADQHALFFPSFGALVRLADEAAQAGAPALAVLSDSARDARTRERYERQLCLSLDAWARRLGELAVTSVAITGSDPYLRTGTDVAILFEARQPELLYAFVRARQDAARQAAPEAANIAGTVGAQAYEGVLSPSRRLSSFVAIVGGAVVVTNSEHQLARLAATASGAEPSLAARDEYRYFRTRYERDDPEETALLVLPDAAIRRWCGPRWRIATSRRTRAAAALAELQAAHVADLAAGIEARRSLETRPGFPVLGNLHLTPEGVLSEKYGTLDFQTPIAELELERASKAEADLYARWRDGYQRNWSNFFDPIAVRFTVADGEVGADLTVLPLILGTEYQDFVALGGDAALAPGSGDPHPEAVFHFALALDPDSEPVREAGSMLSVLEDFGAHPLAWMGGTLAVYFDRDPIWADLAASGNWEEVAENVQVDPNSLPVVLHVAVASPVKLAAFLTTLRTAIESTAPGLLAWDMLEHGTRKYVRITAKDVAEDMALYYATLPGALLVSLHEPTLQRAIDRLGGADEAARAAEGTEAAPLAAEPWLGKNVAVRIERDGLLLLQAVLDEEWSEEARLASWANLPILNEWKRLFPGRDPVAVHEELWGERLLCPAGGAYVWNETWHTMESTVCGHPGAPGSDVDLPAVLREVARLRGGLTFENGGLRAAARLHRNR